MSAKEESGWFHIILTTYGAWLPGDSRGFRTRDHRRHVDGDYKNPPPAGKYEGLYRASQSQMSQPPVTLSEELRQVAGKAIKSKPERLGALVVCVAVAGRHVHILAKMPRTLTRIWIGHVKRHVWFDLRDEGWKSKLWAKGAKYVVIKDRRHQLNVFRYIRKHSEKGAWVWYWDQPGEGKVDQVEPGEVKGSERKDQV